MKVLKTGLWASAALIGLAIVAATPAAADFVINDDLIVDGSACIGFDCVNGESFGFDTIRLKENNLRIKFDDTSVAASFPRNDWQLVANESANGGASKFSIEDFSNSRTPFTIEAFAPTHSLYVDDGGRLGLGTSTPSVELHIIDGDTPTLRLQQDASSGFEPQTWDVAGNETNFFVRDVTHGSTLPFRIRPEAPSSSVFINTNGDVGLGTSSPTEALHVSYNEAVDTTGLLLSNLGAGGARFELRNTTASWLYTAVAGQARISKVGSGGNEVVLQDQDPTGVVQTMTVAGDISAVDFNATSSRELKTDIVPLDTAEILAKVDGLPVSEWRFKSDDSGTRHYGPMAEDFAETFGLGSDNKHLSGVDVQGVALAAIKGLNQKVESENAALKAELARLSQLVEDLVSQQ